jgi:hypothetical protein
LSPSPSLGNDASSTNYLISNKYELPTIDSIGFVVEGFWMCLKDWTSNIFGEMPCKSSCTCFLIHFRKAVLNHRPMSMIEKLGTPARYIAIAAPLLIECFPISDCRIPSCFSPIVYTPSLMRVEIMSEVILMILFPFFDSETGESMFVPLYERFPHTIETQSLTGHRNSSKVFH